jgi:beta-barrel assembly-enhancing protease
VRGKVPSMIETLATYFDGQSARNRTVHVRQSETELTFSGPETVAIVWSIKGLHPIDAPTEGQPYRLSHDEKPGARLIIRDQAFIDGLVNRSKHLKGGYSGRDIGNIIGWTAGGLALCGALTYLAMWVLPDPIAHMLPQSWRDRTGTEMETSLAGGAKRCSTPEGEHALGAIVAALAESTPTLPPVSIHVYDMSMVNAFAVTGGKIVVTKGLLDKADKAEELTGVLAHEMGHVWHFHPEAQMVRLGGMEVLGSIMTGTNGGNTTTNVAMLATVLRSSRAAEAEADQFANEALIKAKIDPQGLRTFFEKIMKIEKEHSTDSAVLGEIGSIFSTHPGTEERIKEIKLLPVGVAAKPVLTDQEWQALKKICG